MAAERQWQATARLDPCALLSAQVFLDPSNSQRAGGGVSSDTGGLYPLHGGQPQFRAGE
jgi:hypothetical protein